jgi:hypothetical protein
MNDAKYIGYVEIGIVQCRAFLAWRRGDNRRKQKGNVSEPRR